VLGVGSELRGDDASGIVTALEVLNASKEKRLDRIRVFFGGTAPENLTGEIKNFRPSHLIIIDTVDTNKKPGSILVMRPNDIGRGVTFSTHAMPLNILARYIEQSLKRCKILIIGIQPKSVRFGAKLSPKVKISAGFVAESIIYALNR
jgi:hydrogenase 3 maturation protease